MRQIVFRCPPTKAVTGGIKHLFKMAEVLRELGFDAIVVWTMASAHSGAQLSDGLSYRDYGVMDVISTTRSIDTYVRHRHPGVKSHLVPYAIDTGVFKPAQTKREAITYLPRKRPIEANYLRDSFRYAFPDLRGWDWWPLVNESEANVAAAMGEAGVFLSLGRLESLGLTPLEAMACGCVVDRAAVELAQINSLPRVAYHEACWATLAKYSQHAFVAGVQMAWEAILKG